MKSFGFDISFTGTGLSVIDEDGYHETTTFGTTVKDPDEKRIMDIAQTILDFLDDNNYRDGDKISIENIAINKKGAAVHRLAALNYYVRIRLFECEIPFDIVSPTTLKKFVLQKHNKKGTGKEHMLLHCFKRWNQEFNNNNMCDAYCLAQYGRKDVS